MTRKKKIQGIVKDEFRDVAFWNGDSLILCTDCLKDMLGGVQLSIILDDVIEEVYCEQCSCMNAIAAYVCEIDIPEPKLQNVPDGKRKEGYSDRFVKNNHRR